MGSKPANGEPGPRTVRAHDLPWDSCGGGGQHAAIRLHQLSCAHRFARSRQAEIHEPRRLLQGSAALGNPAGGREEKGGQLQPGARFVEGTAGNTASCLTPNSAMPAGYRSLIVNSRHPVSREITCLRSLGADVAHRARRFPTATPTIYVKLSAGRGRRKTPGAILGQPVRHLANRRAHYRTPVRENLGARPGHVGCLGVGQTGTGGQPYAGVALISQGAFRPACAACSGRSPWAKLPSTAGQRAGGTEAEGKIDSRGDRHRPLTANLERGSGWMDAGSDRRIRAPSPDLRPCSGSKGCSSEDPWHQCGRRPSRPPAVSGLATRSLTVLCDSGRPLVPSRLITTTSWLARPQGAQPAPASLLDGRGNLMEKAWPART